MKGLNVLLAAAVIVGFTVPAANAAPDNLRQSSAKGGIGDRARTGGKLEVPVVDLCGNTTTRIIHITASIIAPISITLSTMTETATSISWSPLKSKGEKTPPFC